MMSYAPVTIAPVTIVLLISAALFGSPHAGLAQAPAETEVPANPPVDQLPVEQPPVEEPPVEESPVEELPNQAPTDSVPAEQEPSNQAPVNQAPTNQVPTDYQVIMGDGWSFAVPPDWQNALTSSAELGDASIVAQLNDNQKQTVVNLVTQAYSGEGSEYIQRSVETLTDLGFTVHAQEPITVSGLQGVALEVSLTSNERTVRLWQRMIVGDDVSFALTCGGPEANLEAAQPICTNILNSFQVIP